jgi:hypothetical protein
MHTPNGNRRRRLDLLMDVTKEKRTGLCNVMSQSSCAMNPNSSKNGFTTEIYTWWTVISPCCHVELDFDVIDREFPFLPCLKVALYKRESHLQSSSIMVTNLLWFPALFFPSVCSLSLVFIKLENALCSCLKIMRHVRLCLRKSRD